jgi:hypothetical protein
MIWEEFLRGRLQLQPEMRALSYQGARQLGKNRTAIPHHHGFSVFSVTSVVRFPFTV